jgi:hypothetical protein
LQKLSKHSERTVILLPRIDETSVTFFMKQLT